MFSQVSLSTILPTQRVPRAVKHRTLSYSLLWVAILFFEMLIGASSVHASYCRITNVSYSYPSLVTPGQKFSTSTTVTGSCETGEDYFVRVDVIDKSSGHMISSSRSPVLSYNASNFMATVSDSVTAPALATAAWNVEFAVVIFHVSTTGLQDSVGMAVRDYSTVGYATIQVGASQPVPEFAVPNSALIVAFIMAILLSIKSGRMLNRKGKRERS